MVRRLLLIVVCVFVAADSPTSFATRFSVLSCVNLFFVAVHISLWPYSTKLDNYAETVALFLLQWLMSSAAVMILPLTDAQQALLTLFTCVPPATLLVIIPFKRWQQQTQKATKMMIADAAPKACLEVTANSTAIMVGNEKQSANENEGAKNAHVRGTTSSSEAFVFGGARGGIEAGREFDDARAKETEMMIVSKRVRGGSFVSFDNPLTKV